MLGSYPLEICVEDMSESKCSESRSFNIVSESSSSSSSSSSGGGGGGNNVIIKPKPKAQSINNTATPAFDNLIGNKIILEEGQLSYVDVAPSKDVVVELNGILYDLKFELSGGEIILKVSNGDYLIPKNDSIAVMFGEKEIYIGLESINKDNARVVFGLNNELVKSKITIDSLVEDSKGGVGRVFFVIGIIGLILVIIAVLFYFVVLLSRIFKAKDALKRLSGGDVLPTDKDKEAKANKNKEVKPDKDKEAKIDKSKEVKSEQLEGFVIKRNEDSRSFI